MKRFLSRVLLIGALALALTVAACDLAELNDNPNAPSDVQISYLFTNAQVGEVGGQGSIASTYWGIFELGYFGNYYAQYWATTTYPEEPRYQFPIQRSGVVSDMFGDYYFILNDLQEVVRIARANPDEAALIGGQANVIAMAGIQQAWVWQLMSDIWGPLPFETALAGQANVRPAYASQETIYKSLIDSLAIYAEQLTGGTALAQADKLFSGDTGLWQAFANGLRMRLAIRMSCAEGSCTGGAQSAAADAFRAAFNATSFTDLPDQQNALLPFRSSQPYVNPLYANTILSGRDDWATSRTLTRVMNDVADPRRPVYAQPSPTGGNYEGIPYGLTQQLLPQFKPDFSLPGERVAYTATAPAILYTEAEEYFMLAEAAERGWIPGSAAEYYEDGIRASLTYWSAQDPNVEITPAEIEAYIARVPYNNSNGWAPAPVGGDPVWTQTLGIQKWLALYMQGVQGWSVFRRLDFDNVHVYPPDNPGQTIFGRTFPARLPFPSEEPSLNNAPPDSNYTSAVENYLNGTDTQGTPLWWDDTEIGQPLGEAPITGSE